MWMPVCVNKDSLFGQTQRRLIPTRPGSRPHPCRPVSPVLARILLSYFGETPPPRYLITRDIRQILLPLPSPSVGCIHHLGPVSSKNPVRSVNSHSAHPWWLLVIICCLLTWLAVPVPTPTCSLAVNPSLSFMFSELIPVPYWAIFHYCNSSWTKSVFSAFTTAWPQFWVVCVCVLIEKSLFF